MLYQKHLTLREAATASGRSYWRLRAAVLSGDLRATQFSPRGKIYIKPSDLEKYFEDHTVSPLSGKVA
jgi:hypothetical protein